MEMIPLTKGLIAIVDYDDWITLRKYQWRAVGNRNNSVFYAVRTKGKKLVRMHREITNAPRGMEVDHFNHLTLDNRKQNLKIVTSKYNKKNCRSRGSVQK